MDLSIQRHKRWNNEIQRAVLVNKIRKNQSKILMSGAIGGRKKKTEVVESNAI